MTHVFQPLAGGFRAPWGELPSMRAFPVMDIPDPIMGRVFGGRDNRAFHLLGFSTNFFLGPISINAGVNGQAASFGKSATALLSGLSGGTATATNLIPAGSLVIGVSTRVTTLITGATSYSIGDGTTADLWGATIAVAAGTTTSIANFTGNGPEYHPSATSVVLTANGGNFTAGAVRVTIHYIDLTAATS